MTLFTQKASYRFLGHRDYVHGSSMLRSMLMAIGEMCGQDFFPSRIKQFRIIKEFNSNAYVECGSTANIREHGKQKEAVARLDLVLDERPLTALLVPSPESPVESRDASYDAADYVERIELGEDGLWRAKLHRIEDVIDLLRGVIEGYRQALIEEAQVEKVHIEKMRWGYVTDFPIKRYTGLEQRAEVQISPRAIVPNRKQRFVVRDFSFPGQTETHTSGICFYQELR